MVDGYQDLVSEIYRSKCPGGRTSCEPICEQPEPNEPIPLGPS